MDCLATVKVCNKISDEERRGCNICHGDKKNCKRCKLHVRGIEGGGVRSPLKKREKIILKYMKEFAIDYRDALAMANVYREDGCLQEAALIYRAINLGIEEFIYTNGSENDLILYRENLSEQAKNLRLLKKPYEAQLSESLLHSVTEYQKIKFSTF